MNIYRERVLPSAGNLALPLLLFVSVFTIMLPVNAEFSLPTAALFSLGLAGLMIIASPVVVVTDEELIVKGARIEKKFLGKMEQIPKDRLFEALGSDLNSNAWLSIQASVKGLVKIEINDPDDDCPYWMVSTRNPSDLIRAIES